MSLVHTVHPCEAIVNRLASIRQWARGSVRDSRLGLGAGLGLAALAGAPMPLPQLSLAGPILASFAFGKLGGRAAAAVGFVSYLAANQPAPGAAVAAGAIALLVGWGVPRLFQETGGSGEPDGAAAIVVNCDGFAGLDESYGPGTSGHVQTMLRRALEMETRESDLVVDASGEEIVLVVEGSDPKVAQAIMARVERRFSAWLADAGYECNLSVGIADAEQAEEDLLRAARRSQNGFYLD